MDPAAKSVGGPVAPTCAGPHRTEAFCRLGGTPSRVRCLSAKPGRHCNFSHIRKVAIAAPTHDVVAINSHESLVLLGSVPAKPVVENRGLNKIPFARTSRKTVQIDENGSAVVGQDDVAYIRVAMHHAARQRVVQRIERAPRLRKSSTQILRVVARQDREIWERIVGSPEGAQRRQPDVSWFSQRVQTPDEVSDFIDRRLHVLIGF